MELFKAQSKVYKESIIFPIEWNDVDHYEKYNQKNMGIWIKNNTLLIIH